MKHAEKVNRTQKVEQGPEPSSWQDYRGCMPKQNTLIHLGLPTAYLCRAPDRGYLALQSGPSLRFRDWRCHGGRLGIAGLTARPRPAGLKDCASKADHASYVGFRYEKDLAQHGHVACRSLYGLVQAPDKAPWATPPVFTGTPRIRGPLPPPPQRTLPITSPSLLRSKVR